MEISVSVTINKTKATVWDAIVDIENCQSFITSIEKIDILEKPKDTLKGFKWKETRVLFGKEATETMEITDYENEKFYQTRADNHGSVYISKLSLDEINKVTRLTMSFKSIPETFVAKIMSTLMSFMIKGSMQKALLKDLNDIKNHLEK